MKKDLNDINSKLETNFSKYEAHELNLQKNPFNVISYRLNLEIKQMEEILDDLLSNPNLDAHKKVRKILFLKDRCRFVYDEMRFQHERYNWDILKHMKNMKDSIDYLASDYLKSIPECEFITTTNSVVIENEKKVEIPTTITGTDKCVVDDILFYGYFASNGYLEPSCEYDSRTGMHIYANNLVPKEVEENYDICGYHYCEPDMTRYFEAGIYRLEKGQTVGLQLIRK